MFTQNMNVDMADVVGNVELPTCVETEQGMDTGVNAVCVTVPCNTFHC